ncbi:MAG: hypothetical protein CV087_13265 [Candidatus Brocadia sp. WS118]|nr:MAG: hypothetical protein CV087_13265 [Candidatus Brocadia sp. WS118]
MKKSKKSTAKNTNIITCQLPQPCIAKYLVVVVVRGMASEVNYFNTLKEAKRAFGEIACDYGCELEEINESDKYDISIWEWAEERYERVEFCRDT